MDEAVIVGAARTPIGAFNGAFASVSATELGAAAVAEALRRTGLDAAGVDEVLLGNALQAGLGQGPARQAALAAGIPEHVPSTTVNKICGSGLKAVALAAQAIRAGDARTVVAGGMESMTQAPHVASGLRAGVRMGDVSLVDSMVHDGLTCAMGRHHMGVTAENIARELGIGRDDQDAYAAESQRRAAAAVAAGAFTDEIVPVTVPRRRGEPLVVDRDEGPRPDTTVDGLSRLRAVFEDGGTVTAGNSSTINDGAAAVVVTTARHADAAGLRPLAAIRGYASAGVAPRVMGLGTIPAVRRAVEAAGVPIADIGLFELNEAFAAQSVAVIRDLDIDPAITNVSGGAIALGHPIGASGARILTTLLYGMAQRDVRYGLAALCIGGGQGIAMVVERP